MVESTRWAVLGGDPPSVGGICLFVALAAALCLSGLKVFRRLEADLVDLI
jgi:ABC-type polysaccharide/polyol phosphate export permease